MAVAMAHPSGVIISKAENITANTAKTVAEQATFHVMATKSAYENVAISHVSDYVNVRSEANTTSTIVGKIYNNCAATILSTVSGEGGNWYQIQSGTVTGYIKSEYFITGAEAEAMAKQVGTQYATVINTTSLRLREQPSLDSTTLTLLPDGGRYEVLEETGDFIKLAADGDLSGYVSKDYVQIEVEFEQAVSVAEEAAKTADAAQRKQEAETAIKQLDEIIRVEALKIDEPENTVEKPDAGSSTGTSGTTTGSGNIAANPEGNGSTETVSAPTKNTAGTVSGSTGSSTSGSTKAPTSSSTTSSSSQNLSGMIGPGSGASTAVTSATRTAVVAYAKQFLGNPYVFGGTSLTNGTDCSGFTQGIYAHFGITTGRSSRDQAVKGKQISTSAVQPGDLLFYASGDYINHVAMYIGNNQVIHAASVKSGITISQANYRTPCKAVTFLD